jgi:hypothetical protein
VFKRHFRGHLTQHRVQIWLVFRLLIYGVDPAPVEKVYVSEALTYLLVIGGEKNLVVDFVSFEVGLALIVGLIEVVYDGVEDQLQFGKVGLLLLYVLTQNVDA